MVTLYRTRRLLRTSPEKLKTVRSPVPSPSSDLRLRSGHLLTHPIRPTRICAAANLERTMTMAIKANFSQGAHLLSEFGDSADNTITTSRDAAGQILVNGGAVSIVGGPATVANTALDPGVRPGRQRRDHARRVQRRAARRRAVRRNGQRRADRRLRRRSAVRPVGQRHPPWQRRQRLAVRWLGQRRADRRRWRRPDVRRSRQRSHDLESGR